MFGGVICIIYFLTMKKVKPKVVHTVADPYWSDFYKVTRDDNGDIYMNPKTTHKSTVIFLHDFGVDNTNAFKMFAN